MHVELLLYVCIDIRARERLDELAHIKLHDVHDYTHTLGDWPEQLA